MPNTPNQKSIKDFFGPELYKQLKSLKLKPRQILFCINYINNDFNGTQAYIDSKMGGKKLTTGSASVRASKLLGEVNIKQAVRLVMDAWLDSQKLNLDRKIVEQLKRRAFYDPTELIDENGELKFKTLAEVPVELRCCIDGIERKFFGKDADRSTTVYKLADREAAMDRLAKYITLFKDTPTTINMGMSEETAKKLHDIFRAGEKEKDKA